MSAARHAILAVLLLSLPPWCSDLGAEALTPQAKATGARPVQTVVLREGTEVNLEFAQKLTAKAAVVNQPVELVVAEDLKVVDYVVVKKGARVLGTVIAGKQEETKRAEAKALAIHVDFLHSGDHLIKLRGEKIAEGKRNKDAMVAGTILLGVSGLILTSDKHYVIPEGTPLKAYVDDDIELPVLGN